MLYDRSAILPVEYIEAFETYIELQEELVSDLDAIVDADDPAINYTVASSSPTLPPSLTRALSHTHTHSHTNANTHTHTCHVAVLVTLWSLPQVNICILSLLNFNQQLGTLTAGHPGYLIPLLDEVRPTASPAQAATSHFGL